MRGRRAWVGGATVGAMEFGEAAARRRMVRSYTTDPVDPAVLDRIARAGLRAPSAGFSQGQTLVVVTDPDTRREIARLAGEPGYVRRGFEPWLSRAPVHIIVCTSREAYLSRYREPDKSRSSLAEPGVGAEGWPVPYWWVDAGAVLQNLLLAAVDEGLAAGFLGAHAIPGLAALLAIPEHHRPIGVVTVGRPAPAPAAGPPPRSARRPRRPASETIRRERWR